MKIRAFLLYKGKAVNEIREVFITPRIFLI